MKMKPSDLQRLMPQELKELEQFRAEARAERTNLLTERLLPVLGDRTQALDMALSVLGREGDSTMLDDFTRYVDRSTIVLAETQQRCDLEVARAKQAAEDAMAVIASMSGADLMDDDE